MATYAQPGLTLSKAPDKFSPVNGYNYWVFTGDFNTASTTADINLSKLFVDLEILNQSYATPIDGSFKETLGRFKVPARTGSLYLFDPQKLLDTKVTFPYDNPLITTDGYAGLINESTGFGSTAYGYAIAPFIAPEKDSIARYRLHYGLEWDPNIDFTSIQGSVISGTTYSQYVIPSYTASNPNSFVSIGDTIKISTTSGLYSYFIGTASVKAFTYSASGTYITTDQPWITDYGTYSIPGTIDLVQHFYGYSDSKWVYNGVRQYEEKGIDFGRLYAFNYTDANLLSMINPGGGYTASDTLQVGSGAINLSVNTISVGSGLIISVTLLGAGSSIVNFNITSAGTGYHVNDRVKIGSGNAVGRVLAVGGSGNITSLSMIVPGTGYSLSSYTTTAISGAINTYTITSFSMTGYTVGTTYNTTTLTGNGLYSTFKLMYAPVYRFMNDWGRTSSQAIPIKAGQGERVRFIKDTLSSQPTVTLYTYDNGSLVYSGPIPGFSSTTFQWAPSGSGFAEKCFTMQVFDQNNTIPIVHNRIYRFSLSDGNYEQSIYYIGDTSCSKYENIRIKFMNRQGSWCYWNFNRDLKHTTNISRTEYKQPLKYDYSLDFNNSGYALSKQRGSAVLSSSVIETYTLNSDWITEEAGNYLSQLLTSPEVYIFYDTYTQIDGSVLTSVNIPIIITDNNYTFKTLNRDKLFNLTINYKLAYDTVLQNQ